MNFKALFFLCFSIVASLVFQSCEEPVKTFDTSLLSGKWLIVDARRNAKPTTTLNEAFFVFNSDSTMQTNFTGEELDGRYSIEGSVIQQDTEDNYTYTIQNLSKDTLILSTEIQKYNFELLLLNARLDPFNENEEDELLVPHDHQQHADS